MNEPKRKKNESRVLKDLIRVSSSTPSPSPCKLKTSRIKTFSHGTKKKKDGERDSEEFESG